MISHHFSCSCCNPMWKYFLPEGVQLTVPTGALKTTSDQRDRVTLIHKRGEEAIITMKDGEPSMAEAMVTLNDKVYFVGDWQRAEYIATHEMPVKDPQFQLCELKGEEVIVPGMIDPHMHTLPTALINLFLDAGPFDGQVLRKNYNVEDVKSILRDGSNTDMPWVLAHDVDPSLFTGAQSKALNKSVLDTFGIDKPIFAMNASMHLAYKNSLGAERLQEEGLEVSEDGILQEAPEIIPALKVVVGDCRAQVGDFNQLMFEQVQEIFATASKRGITTLLDAGVEPSDPNASGLADQPGYLSAMAHDENCPVRLGAALAVETVDDFTQKVQPHFHPGQGDDYFFTPFVKIVSDGSNQGMTGYQYQTYCCNEDYVVYTPQQREKSDNYGLFNFPDADAFEALVKTAHEANWPLMIHANGDHAISRTIKAYKKVCKDGETLKKGRNRIEHCSLASDDHLQDMQDYGISPSFLIGHVGYWGYSFKTLTLGEERANLLDRCKSALKHGLKYTVHSDNSVSPLGVLRMMEQSISRYMEGAPAEAPEKILNANECVTPLEALRAATLDAAWQCHMDHKIGSLEEGKLADFVLLAQSPLTYQSGNPENPVAGMRDIKVLETWKGGKKFKY